jgi:O-antigen/teichoic acid export membrane protein
MSQLKKLASQTAIYGLSSIIGRFLNYFLVPLYTAKGAFDPAQYGVVTEFYAYVAFLAVILTYGLETALFRYYLNNAEGDKEKIYATSLISILASSGVFMLVVIFLSSPIATGLGYQGHANYIIWFAMVLGFDAISNIPFAKLRADSRPLFFAVVKLSGIAMNIGLNLFFIRLCKPAHDQHLGNWLASCYDPEIGVGYVFLCNLASSAITLLLLLPMLRGFLNGFDKEVWKKMMRYGLPIVLISMAGIINETLDRALLKHLLPFDAHTNQYNLGVYGACYKLATLMTICIQAFRYAAEPFYFSRAGHADAKALYARVLDYFTIFGAVVFLTVNLYIDIFKEFIRNPEYHVGLGVVPILLMANLFLGIYVNLSIWYKLTDKTRIGAWVAGFGAVITIVLNVWWIPTMGYMGSAWATLVVYFYMAAVSYLLGRKYYPVDYHLLRIGFYIGFALALYFTDTYFTASIPLNVWVVKTLWLLIYCGVVALVELRSSKLTLAPTRS